MYEGFSEVTCQNNFIVDVFLRAIPKKLFRPKKKLLENLPGETHLKFDLADRKIQNVRISQKNQSNGRV